MSKRIFVILLLFLVTTSHGQQIGTWSNYTDMKNTVQSTLTDEGIWSVSSGGAFHYDMNEQSYNLFTKSNGLSSHMLTSVAVDSEGKIWLGTQEGVINVYNPATSTIKKILDIYNSDKSQKRINEIFVSGETVYVSTSFGLSLINSSDYSFIETIVKFGDFSAETSVNGSLQEYLLYVCTSKGVAIQKEGAQNLSAPESWNSFTIDANTTYKIVNWNGGLAMATDNGIFLFDGTNWISALYQNLDIKDVATENTALFVLIDHALYKFDNSISTLIYENYEVDFSAVSIRNNIYYISTSQGVLEINNENTTSIFPNSPGSNSFQSLGIDLDGQIWVGSGTDVSGIGIFNFDGSAWTNYNIQNTPELGTNAFHTVYTAPDGTVYFANWGNGFTRLRDGIFTTYNTTNTEMVGITDDPAFLVIGNLMNDSQNNTWILNYQSATRNPLSVLTADEEWYHFEFTDPLISSNMILDNLVIDQFGTKWFAVTIGNRGLYYFNENNTLSNTADDEIGYVSSTHFASDLITALAVDNRGEIWVGTNKGLNIIQNPSNPTSQITSSFGLSQQTINDIEVDPLNQKWIATNQGLFLMSQDGIRILDHYDTQNSPLPSDQILSLAMDKESGVLYIGSESGMTSLSTDAIQPAESFTELFVYPNPFIVGAGDGVELTIDGLIRDSEIKILSINGNLIREFITPGGRVARWDGRDENGSFVNSGIYIIVAYDEEANDVAKAKVAVLKK